MVTHEAEPTLGMKTALVIGHDARRFLTAVLQSMEPEGRDGRRLFMVPDAENAAFLPKPVGLRSQTAERSSLEGADWRIVPILGRCCTACHIASHAPDR